MRGSENLLIFNVYENLSVWHLTLEFQVMEFLSPLGVCGFLARIKFSLKVRLEDYPVGKLKHTNMFLIYDFTIAATTTTITSTTIAP